MGKYGKNGISLILLVITIIVIVILATVVIMNLTNIGITDSSKKARFMSDYRSVEEGVNLYSMGNIDTSNSNNFPLPLEGKLSLSDKQDITNNVPTLNTKIEELNPGKTIDDIDLYYINEADAGINNLATNKQEKGYIIDAATRQIYDYVGDSFEGKRWHTLDGGIVETGLISGPEDIQELWNGWIRLTLYYPASSTDKKWRLGSEGELRVDPMLMWQDYTGPITIPLDRTKDVWIKYKIDNTEVVIPPAGTLLVDIVPDKIGTTKVEQVNLKINYDSEATTKEYKIGNSGWMPYIDSFVVTENCIIEARAKKTENVYNADGSLLLTRDITGSDMVYIGNIGKLDVDNKEKIEEITLAAPTIIRLPAVGSEKARVEVTYPANADKKIYTINYGLEEEYVSDINVQDYGTYVITYYYDASGKRSVSAAIYINDTTTGQQPIEPVIHEPVPPYNPENPLPFDPTSPIAINLIAPTITRIEGQNAAEKARVQITYPGAASKKIYTQNYGNEQNYLQDIVVSDWGTFIMAYYYDVNGNKSAISYIRINETVTPPDKYIPPEIIESVPTAPTININPSSGIVTEVSVSVTSPSEADKTYIKIGRYGNYQEYTSAMVVRDNLEIYAYYKTSTGKESQEARGKIQNIRQPGDIQTAGSKPYVYIDAVVYPWSSTFGQKEVSVTVLNSGADKIEYSDDGIIYTPYTAPFTVTENKRIYAKATNVNGVAEAHLDITNIGKLTPPKTIQKLAININVNPEPSLSTFRVATATVAIEYDAKAVEKFYRIGPNGDLMEYTGSFVVDKSCTVYAYAKAPDSLGQTSKTIDNIIDGISDPVITAAPDKLTQSTKVAVKIEYDKYATVKRYSIDGGILKDYTGEFEITKNGTKINAFSQNIKGQISNATYTIENIVPTPPVLTLDKGNYYLLKLNYPEASNGREYKWTLNGEWKSYKEDGILLIKPQFKDELLKNGTLVKIEDENGNMVTFTGDYYLINIPISEMFENISMRWDRVTPSAPQIILNTTEPAIQVIATIVYDPALIKKQYRVLNPGEAIGDWLDYTGPITVDRNNAIIYAKGLDESEVWSSEGIQKVINIDENSPVINLTADLVAETQKVAVKVSVTDDVAVERVKWAEGIQGESYFTSSGTDILNDSIVNISSNGYYTFYGEDKVGNKQVYTLNVINVDLNPPLIDIAISPESTVGITTNVTINYGDSTIKQYKIGTNNIVWTNYTSVFALSSNTILSNNWKNADGTVTIYAKGKDLAGNEIIIQKKILNLDLDKPNVPVINTSSGYPKITEYGVIIDNSVNITYDNRLDIDNYYSINNGTTWSLYTVPFNVTNASVIAKSVKKTTGLEVSASKTISIPTDAMEFSVYDGNDLSYSNATNKYIEVDSDMYGKLIRVYWYSESSTYPITLRFYDASNSQISIVSKSSGTFDDMITVPANTKRIKFETVMASRNGIPVSRIHEIGSSNEPKFSAQNGYMLLTADITKAIRNPYQMVTVMYSPVSVQRLYKIGTSGNWLDYPDQPIKVDQGLTIYAKGIDKNGIETRIISSLTANVSDSMGSQAYDGNISSYISLVTGKYMDVDSDMQGKSIIVRWYSYSATYPVILRFLDGNNQQITYVTRTSGTADDIYTIPANTKRLKYEGGMASVNGDPVSKLFEIQSSNEPKFSAQNRYMLLTLDPAMAIRNPYQMVTVSYFVTSVQRLYRIGTSGNWLNYSDQPIKVDQGLTIYAKGIDKYGNETRIISSLTANVPDAIYNPAYDGNDTSYIALVTNRYMEVDSGMQGKNIRVRWYADSASYPVILRFLNASNQIITSVTRTSGTANDVYTVPVNTTKIRYEGGMSSRNGDPLSKLFEIGPN